MNDYKCWLLSELEETKEAAAFAFELNETHIIWQSELEDLLEAGDDEDDYDERKTQQLLDAMERHNIDFIIKDE